MITINLSDVNEAPVLGAIGNRTTDELATLAFTASATDVDAGQTLSYSLDAAALALGMTINAATGQFSWTPSEAQGPGVYNVTLTVADSGTPQLTDSETIQITVNEVNQDPSLGAIGDRTVNEGELLTFTISGTDADLPANTLTFNASNLPTGATFDANTRTFSWTPTEAQGPGVFTGITFSVSDGQGGTDSETIQITVNEVNQAPVLGAIGNRTVQVGATLTFTVTATDADLPANLLTLSSTTLPTGATFDPTTGVFSWSPTVGQTGDTPLTFTVTDNGTPQLSDSETLTITVTAEANQNPVVDDQSFTIAENSANGTVVGTIVATDPNVGQALSYALTGTAFAVNPTTGQITVADSALLNFETTPSFVLTATVTDNGTPTLNDTAVITINLSDVNEAPVVNDQTFTIAENSANGTVVGTIVSTDPDAGQTRSYAVTGGTGQTAFLVNATTGQITVADSTLLDFETTPSFILNVTVTDSGSPQLSDTAVITINLTDVAEGENRNPDAVDDAATTRKNQQIAVNVLANDSDPDGDSLTIVSVTDPQHGTIEIQGACLVYTPDCNFTGVDSVVYTVSDGKGGTDTATFTITVKSDRNHKPEAKNDRYDVNEDEVLTVSAPGVLANDRDRDGDGLAASLVYGPRHGTLEFNADGSFVYTPDANFHGKDSFTYRVSDGEAESRIAKVEIRVHGVNDAPVLDAIADQTVEQGSKLRFNVTASDVDGRRDRLTFSLADGAPAGATINARTGEFKWTPSAQQGPGVYQITVNVTDGKATDSETFTVTVTERIIRETLVIKGTTGCDVIKVCEADGGVLNVSVNGEKTAYKLASGTKVEVYGLDGNDAIILKGLNRDASVYGGNGNDLIDARQVTNGNVRLFGENGCDVLIGGCGDDLLDGGNGKDLLIGGGGKDQLKGENGKDWLFGGKGDDALFGGNARDLLIGGDGDDFLNGGHGKDVKIQDRSYWDKLKTNLSKRDWVKEFLDCRLT